jgi:hypothetical protein
MILSLRGDVCDIGPLVTINGAPDRGGYPCTISPKFGIDARLSQAPSGCAATSKILRSVRPPQYGRIGVVISRWIGASSHA